MEFNIRKAVPGDVGAIMEIMEEGKATIENQEWFVADDEVYIREHIDKNGFTIVAESEDDRCIAGFFVVKIPEKGDNLGELLGFDVDKLEKVVIMDSAVVGRKYRGNHLQQRMLEAAEAEIDEKFRYLMCTVHPDNKYSLQNMEKYGYKIEKTTECYGGLRRYILVKDKRLF